MIRGLIKNGTKILSRRQSSILSAAGVLSVTFGLSALLGIYRDRLLYAKFYSCCTLALDAYNAAFRIPDAIFRLLVTGALSAAFIPVFSVQVLKDKKEAFKTASSVINILFLALLFLTLLIIPFSSSISKLIAPGFFPEQIELMSQLTRTMIFAQLFFLLSNFLTGILQTHQRFLLPALSPIVYNLGIIFGIQFLSPSFGIFGPAFGVLLGAGLHFLIQLPLVNSLGFRYSSIISFQLPGVRKILRLMLPRTLAMGLGEIEATIALFLASALPTGSLSLFYLAQRLTNFFSRVFGVTIGQATLPILSKKVAENNLKDFTQILVSSLLQALYFSAPVASFFLFLRIPIVRLAYGAQQFPWKATVTTGRMIAFFAPLVILNSICDILVRGFYALQDTKTPFYVSLLSLIINVGISLLAIFKLKLGIYGLVLALSLSGLVQVLVLMVLFIKKTGKEIIFANLVSPVIKILTLSFVSGLAVWGSMTILDTFVLNTTRTTDLLVLTVFSGTAGLLVYFLLSSLLKLSEAKILFAFLRHLAVWPKVVIPPAELPPLE